MREGRLRPTRARIDLDAVRHNVALVGRVVAPAALWAVVKADAYGHGAPAVAHAAMEGGAAGLAVALVDEGVELRDAGITAPILMLSEPGPDAVLDAVAAGLTPTVASVEVCRRLEDAARTLGRRPSVHVKVDTGMHRVGVAPDALVALARTVVDSGALRLEGVWTHFAAAERAGEEDRSFTTSQVTQFDAALTGLIAAGIEPPLRHAANTAAAIAWPASRYDLVRCGLAIYGELPSPSVLEALAAVADGAALRPVLTLRSEVTAVRSLPSGARPSYGRGRPLRGPAIVATVPIGYADGVPWRLWEGGQVLIGGRRRPLAGQVTMDQIVVDCGPDSPVRPGDEVVLLGAQGNEWVTPTEWAQLLGTITYEVLCGIGGRVPREVVSTESVHAAGRGRP